MPKRKVQGMTNNGLRLVLVTLHEQFTIGFEQDK